ncbi:hypothetical protein [Streptomyces marincola]|uniref:hypothetical protein n=1 Tax=Streptomyces marincola TaxID=2878388 RepID=UPI001CF220EF|nr:hypothetical protein [Streptomyces marincola]UCM88310.1 hypothetical protein LC193_10275 [Streptomyces marincola]
MIWWCKVRRAHVLLPLGLLSLALLALVLRDSTAALPSFSMSGSNEAKIMLFAPIPLVSTIALCLDSRLPAAEVAGIRPVRGLDTALTGLVLAVAVMVCLLLGVWLDSGTVVAAGRNTVFLTGLLLLLRPVVGEAAVIGPVTWLMAVVLLGFRESDDPYPWTVLPEPVDAPHAALATALALLAGSTLLLRGPRNVP